MLERVPKYTLRKLSVGLASVMIGSGILMNSPKVLADTTSASESTGTGTAVQSSNQNEGNGEIQSSTGTPASGDTHASSGTPASGDTTDATTPTTPSDSTSMAIVNDKNKLDKNWIQLDNGKAQIYFTVKGNDQKPYVTSFMDKDVKSTLYTKRFDPNSLELHIEYQNGDKDAGPGWALQWDDKDLQLNTSRIDTKGLVYTTNSGDEKDVPLSPGNGFYKSYNEWLKEKQDPSKLHLISLWEKVPANSTFTATLPFKYVGNADVVKSTRVDVYLKPYSTTLTFDPFELHPAQIETPAKPTTDKDTVTTGIYNNPLITTSDWLNMVHGEAIAYYTAKGKDGKTYVTGYVAANGKSQSIINVKQVDLSTLEYHLIYHNGDKEVGSGLWANFADNKTIAIDTSRLGADGPQLKSQQGWSYKWAINGPKDGGIYYDSWAEYLKAHNNVGDQATNISMTGVTFKPNDMVELVIPVKYTGQLSARTPSLTFSPHINDYGKGFTQNWADLYFTTVKKDLSEVKEVDLLPTEFMGEKTGESDWKLVKEISKDMPNGWDAFKISNFPTYKGSFNMDSLPKGDKPSVVYGSAQYFIDLSKIQEIFANHGYTVKYANNNGKAQEMPFYAYSTIPLAKRVDDDRPVSDDPSIWVIHVQAVPALILNKDQHYVANPNAKQWDTTSMIDEIYAADDAGQRKTRDQLEKLPKTDVDISYEYQAPGAATAAAVDKVDLTKAGVYTVTYSHTYANKQVVKDSRKVYVDDVKQKTKDITRTIIVHEPNGTDQTVIQKATLTREVILDATTGEIKSAGKWSTAKWETYSAPDFKGYTPDVAQVEEATVTKDTQDTTVEINYAANDQQTHVIYVDDDNNGDPIKTEMLNGKTGETVATNIANPDESKYELVGTPEAEYTFAAENNEDVIVHLKHKHGQQVEEKTITRTINVTHPDGSHESIKQTVTLNRTNEVDLATGEVVKDGKWTTGSWEEFVAPEHAGYTPNIAKVEQTDVTADTQDTTVEINYAANKPTTPEQNNDQGQKPQTNDQVQKPQAEDQVTENGKGTATANTQGQTPAPVAQSAQAQKLPHTGEAENRLGILGVLTATLGMLGLGWKKRERQ
ncbi:mucin-binding protein [Lactobacillus crispatus]|uniref:mucin-binding protein n=1 Tax=Lactobacillus crispatus TaxID=47770 RepID=UPI0016671677|nr:YSIRK-type signal peptide-containing protein [Lactobacillus crispatus]MBD0967983.1 YSIRK-type signal peptide-containing protein [Lactobacillus crispatus]